MEPGEVREGLKSPERSCKHFYGAPRFIWDGGRVLIGERGGSKNGRYKGSIFHLQVYKEQSQERRDVKGGRREECVGPGLFTISE